MKKELEKRFKEFYPGKRLLAIHLDGFSHSVIFDNGSGESEIEYEVYSGCAPELFDSKSRVGKLFNGIPHYCYQNNAQELLYVAPNDR